MSRPEKAHLSCRARRARGAELQELEGIGPLALKTDVAVNRIPPSHRSGQ